MSEVLSYRKLGLGETEKYFVRLFSMRDQLSAFDIYLYLKETERETDHKSMAYTNVRKRVKRLEKLGLIKQIKEKHRYRNAINYKLSSHGLFQCMLMMPMDWVIFPHYLKYYKDTIILQTILYQFFEDETLYFFNTVIRTIHLCAYLRDCCEAILNDVEAFRKSKIKDKQKYMTVEHMSSKIEAELNDFVSGIVRLSNVEKWGLIGIDAEGSEYVRTPLRDISTSSHLDISDEGNKKYVFPNLALANDEKFMTVLRDLKSNFDNGCKNFGL